MFTGIEELPRIQYRNGINNWSTITFSFSDCVQFTEEYNIQDYSIHTSVFTGKKIKISKGNYAKFSITINKLTQNMYTALKAMYQADEIRIFPHYIINDESSNRYYLSVCTKFNQGYLNNILDFDMATLEFESIEDKLSLDLPGVPT